MKSSRIVLTACAALVTVVTLAGSAVTSPAAAGGLDWLGNDNYVRCLQYVRGLAHGDEAAYNRGRKTCNRVYYPTTPGVDY